MEREKTEYKDLVRELNTWKYDEKIHREYYFMEKTPENIAKFEERHSESEKDMEWAVHPEKINEYSREDMFILQGYNVSLVKHPRYFPLFYHEHDFFEMIYVLSGSCANSFQDSAEKLTAGDLCLIAPGVRHGILAVEDDSIILNILIRRSTFMDIFYNTVRNKTQISSFFVGNLYSREKIRYLLFHTKNDTVIRNYILDMYREQKTGDSFSDRIICSILTLFFVELTRRHGNNVSIPDSRRERTEQESEMLAYIMGNCSTVTLNELAEKFHFSVPYCSKLVKSITGKTFSNLLTEIRLQQGEQLLLYSQLSVEDISDKVGYKNSESFIRAFRRLYGDTPSQYRRKNK